MRYEKYYIGKLFSSQNGDTDIKKENLTKIGIPVITSGVEKYGILGKTDINAKIIKANTITIDMFGNAFFRPFEYKMVTHARVFSMELIGKKMTEAIGLFLVSQFHWLSNVYNYSNMCSFTKIKDLTITLPTLDEIDENSPYSDEGFIPDFEYMEFRIAELEKERIAELEKERIAELEKERIAELEKERIAELENYLIVTGLNDYTLTDEDKEILKTQLSDGGYKQNSISGNGCLKETKQFKIGDVFEKIETKKIKGKANDFPVTVNQEYNIPLLTAGVENQGLSRYAKECDCQTILSKVLSVSANGANSGIVFYQSEKFAVLQDSYAIKVKNYDIPNAEIGTYLTSCIHKAIGQNHNWNYKAGWNRIKNDYFSLPIQTDDNNNPIIDENNTYHPDGYIPDFDYMEKYIKVIEKLIIKDVVDYKDKMITETKKLTKTK